MNNRFKIKIEAPLLRPGLTIETECSERYVERITELLMDMVRVINEKHSTVKAK